MNGVCRMLDEKELCGGICIFNFTLTLAGFMFRQNKKFEILFKWFSSLFCIKVGMEILQECLNLKLQEGYNWRSELKKL